MPWSHVVETMGFEPTTPCLQTVRTTGAGWSELGSEGAEAASSDFDRPGRVARAWHDTRPRSCWMETEDPTTSPALLAWSVANVRTGTNEKVQVATGLSR
jgi:hypothetical protein